MGRLSALRIAGEPWLFQFSSTSLLLLEAHVGIKSYLLEISHDGQSQA